MASSKYVRALSRAERRPEVITNMAWRSCTSMETFRAVEASPPEVIRESEIATRPSWTFIARQKVTAAPSDLRLGRHARERGEPHRRVAGLRGEEGGEDCIPDLVELALQVVEELVQAPGDDLGDARVAE